MTVKEFPLDHIHPNRYQKRHVAPDAPDVIALAENIRAHGLKQTPVGRPHPDKQGHVELAGGHRRLAAYTLLAKKDKRFATMPVDVQAMDDRALYQTCVIENEQRKALNDIERATTLRDYIAEFKVSQAEAGQLFADEQGRPMTQSAVSNLLRLLQLPAAIQAINASGQLPQRHARGLIVLARSMPQQAAQVARAVAEAENKDAAFDEALEKVLREHGRFFVFYNAPFESQDVLPTLHVADTAKKLGIEGAFFPACKGCEFQLTRGNSHYCARPGCYDLKVIAARWQRVAKAAKALGLVVAPPNAEVKIVFDGEADKAPWVRAMLRAKHPSLRLAMTRRSNLEHWRGETRLAEELLQCGVAALATTDLAALKRDVLVPTKAEPQSPAEHQAAKQERFDRRTRERQANEKAARGLIEQAARFVAPALASVPEPFLRILNEEIYIRGWEKAKTPAARRLAVTEELLDIYLSGKERISLGGDPAATAEALVALANELKLKVPREFAALAAPAPAPAHVRGNGRAKSAKKAAAPRPKKSPARSARKAKAKR